MIRLDVVHIKLPQVIQLHTSMITEYSTVQYNTLLVLYCIAVILSVYICQSCCPNFFFQTLFRYGQVLLCSIIMIHYRSRFTFVRQTFLRIRLSSKSFWFIKQHLLDTLGPPVHVLEMYNYVLLNMQYFQNACFFRYLCSDYCIYKFIKQLKSNLYDVLYFVKNFLSSIN